MRSFDINITVEDRDVAHFSSTLVGDVRLVCQNSSGSESVVVYFHNKSTLRRLRDDLSLLDLEEDG